MINIILGGLGAALGYYLFQSDADYKRGLALLAKNSEDATGNLVVGAYLFSQGKYDEALPYLGKSNLPDVVSATAKDVAGAPNGKYDQLEVGDLWATAAVKVTKYKKQFNDRAMIWYGKCWPDLDGAFKDKLRTRVKQIQGKGGAAVGIQNLTGFKPVFGKASINGIYAYAGKQSVRMDVDPKNPNSTVWSLSYPAQPGKAFTLSAWVLTDGTEGTNDQIMMPIFAQGRQLIAQPTLTVSADTPIWKYYEVKDTFAASAATFEVYINFTSRMGNMFVDNLSVMVDGKEILKNGDFESR